MDTRKTVVNVHEAKTHLSRLLERAHRGETIVLAKAGKPYAKLVPLETRAPRTPGLLKGKFKLTPAFFEPLPEDELRRWEGR
jgi:prevent-host-death family protein